MSTVVISQPMFFPWVGLFEQTRLADAYVHYVDVQFSKGSFTNRVQLKTARGPQWLTLPLKDLRLGQEIREVQIDDRQDWRRQHIHALATAYATAPFTTEMLALVQSVYTAPFRNVGEAAIASMEAIWNYYPGAQPREIHHSSEMGIPGSSSRRVLDIVKRLGGTSYLTGHGARQYLDHSLFESEGVGVEYIHYNKTPYPQQYGEFTPDRKSVV